jgi:hypothetical protein
MSDIRPRPRVEFVDLARHLCRREPVDQSGRVLLTEDRGFEPVSLQRRVRSELDYRSDVNAGCSLDGDLFRLTYASAPVVVQ